ncbi:MAG: DNA polymerase III subunit delta [Oscillospiraceae bacterium]|nr:DNA polymerase III subunit delta [Oscillospiraceae bacterium]
MARYDDVQLFRSLREGQIAPVYLIYGKEIYLSQVCLQRILDKAVKKEAESLNLRKFDGASLDMTAVQTEAEGYPFMADRKAVVLMNPNLEKLSKFDGDLLNELIADPNPTTVLILYVSAYDLNPKKSARIRKLIDAVDQTGAVVECLPKTRSDLVKLVRQKCQKNGCEMDASTAGALIDRCGTGLDELMRETDKLIAYKVSGEITRADVEAVTHKSLDSSVFDLSKAMLQNGRTRAFQILDELFLQREEPLSILSALNSAFLDLYRAKAAMLAGKTADDICALFPYKGREFRIRNAFRDVSRYSAGTLRGCLKVLSDTDLALKSGRADGRVAVTEAVARILALKEDGR